MEYLRALICWLSIGLVTVQVLTGQQLSFRYLGNEQGMKSLATWNGAIDRYGFFWLATGDGLVRFDGKQTTYYYVRDHPTLRTDQIGFVMCSSQNEIWVCTDKGLVCIDNYRQFKHEDIVPDQPEAGVSLCFEGAGQVIYALSAYGAFAKGQGSTSWMAQNWLDTIIDNRRVRDIRKFDDDRVLLIQPSIGVKLINTRYRKLEAFFPLEGVNCATRFDDTSILIGKLGRFGLYHASIEKPAQLSQLTPPSFFGKKNPQEQINYMVRGPDHKVYMSTLGKGLLCLDSDLKTYTRYQHDPLNPSSLITNQLRYILSDSLGNILITSQDGVNYTNVKNYPVDYVNYLVTDKGQVIDDRVISLAGNEDGRIWICTREKILIYHPVLNTTEEVSLPGSPGLSSESLLISYVERDIHNRMWVAVKLQGIFVFNEKGKLIKRLTTQNFPGYDISIDEARVIRQGRDPYMYIGTEKGLFRMHADDFSVDTFEAIPPLQVLRRKRIVDILCLDDGLWVSTSPRGAAWHYSYTEQSMSSYDQTNGLPSSRVYGLTADHKNNMYVGSYGGLSLIYPKDSIVNFVKDLGLISPRIESVETAPDGSIWMTNNYNLLRYDPQWKKMYKLGGRQGLTHVNFVIMSSAVLPSGQLAFGANKGLVIADPQRLALVTDSIQVFLFYHDASGKEIPCSPGTRLEMSHQQTQIRFSTAVNDMILADQVVFRHRLSSAQQGMWSQPVLSGYLEFNLSPGQYQLEVEAFDGQEWFGLGAPVDIHIRQPWWKRVWFIAIVILLITGAAGGYMVQRFKKMKAELQLATQIADLESRALRAQMNPHFVFNSLNAIQECIVTGKIDEAYTYLSKFSRLLRMVLEQSERTEVSLHEELEVLSLFVSLEQLRFRDDMHFDLHVKADLDDEEIHIPPMLIQPHLENAIWHGLRHRDGPKYLRLFIEEKTPGYLDVVIEDNGIGRVRSEEINKNRIGQQRHASKGRQLSGNRMDLLKKTYPLTGISITDLYTESGEACGTRVTLIIPILSGKL